jgi:hypothetical protein
VSDDIVKRLRRRSSPDIMRECREAADEIERLRVALREIAHADRSAVSLRHMAAQALIADHAGAVTDE